MAITKVRQTLLGTGTTTVAANFTVAPSDGNLLIGILTAASSTSGIAGADISGWDLCVSAALGATGFVSIWMRIASGEGTGNITASITGGASTHVIYSEWSDIADVVLDQIQHADSGSGVLSKSTGTTPATTADDELCIAAISWGAATNTAHTWSNSFNAEYEQTDQPIAYSSYVQSAAGTRETTCSWTTNNRIAAACIATFKNGALPITPLAMAQYRQRRA